MHLPHLFRVRRSFSVFFFFALLAVLGRYSRSVAADTLPTGWDGRDIGDVGQPGGAAFLNPTFVITGSGADIWGTADAFHYVSRGVDPVGFTTTMTVRVVSEQNTDVFAKAGLMLRTSYDPSSVHVILDVKPDGGIEFMTRPSPGAETTFIAGASTSFPVWLRLSYDASTVTGSISSDGTNFTTIGSAGLIGAVWLGMAVTSHDNSTVNQSQFDDVHTVVTQNSPTTLPPEWAHKDIGNVGLAGSASYSNGTFTVSGAGEDIWGTEDSFHFVYATRPPASAGPPQIMAHVTGITNTDTFAKAGIMIRSSLDPGASHVILDVRPNGSVEFMSRPSAGGSTAFFAGGTLPGPGWLKLVIAPTVVSGYISADGVHWSKVGDIDISFSSYYVGLAVTSHDSSALNASTFDNVLVNWSSQDIGDVGVPGSAAFANNQFIISGAGSDIWGTSDSFHYVYIPLPANGSGVHRIALHVTSPPQNTSPFAKAGIMIRDSLAPDAAHVIIDVKPDGGVEFMARTATGASTTFIGGGTFTPNGVLILDMNGQSFTGRVCGSDGTGCRVLGTVTAAISATGFMGMAVTSVDPTTTTTARFSESTIN